MKTRLRIVAFAITLAAASAPLAASAQNLSPAQVEEARQHYKRGVELYGESSYNAALVEFRRAYEIAPNFSVLYNIAQIHYQLHDYAEALRNFQAYLQDGGSKVPPARRTEVEKELAYLKERVGYVEIGSNAEGAEVTVDGVSVGKTPIPQAVIVTAGRRRIELLRNDRVLSMRLVEVAAGDHLKVDLNEAPAATATAPVAPARPNDAATAKNVPVATTPEPPPPVDRGPWPAAAWIATGGLAAGTVVTGILALGASNDLKTKRETDGVTRDELDKAQSKTKTLALVTDVLGVVTVVAAGTAAYLTFAPRGEKQASSAPKLQVGIAGTGVALRGAF